MSETMATAIWVIGMIAWFLIRRPHQRRARNQNVANHNRSTGERIALALAAFGLVAVPAIHVTTSAFNFANYSFIPALAWIGTIVQLAFLWLFRESHRQLGKNWSITLEIREAHNMITDGIYRHVRHPMYSAFWLCAIAQALLFPNWIAGFSGIFGISILYFSRVKKEELMMRQTFGKKYDDYCAKTGRVIPRFN